MFPIVHASLALLGLLTILSGGDCLTIVGTEGIVALNQSLLLGTVALGGPGQVHVRVFRVM